MLLALLLGTSLVVQPLHVGDEPPPVAAARRLVLELPAGADAERRAEVLGLARRLAALARAGSDFGALCVQHSSAPEASSAGELGSVVPGVLAPPLDAFLFAAGVGEVSEPFELEGGVAILQRVEAHAAVLRIQVAGDAARRDEHARLVASRLAEGEDFALVARELSDDRASAERGGQYAIFERGARDALMKRMAFQAELGQVFGPLDVPPLGLNWMKRVPLDAVDPELRENTFVRLSAILFQFDTAAGADPARAPSERAAQAQAERALAQLESGADFRALARELSDDAPSRERGGDVGWVHRATPGLSDAVRTALLLAPGRHTPVLRAPAGWILLRRER
jgi:parvulin-like peptidyl-prolyl isomerase